jgi:hypothetical protein
MSALFSIPPDAVRVWRGYRAPTLPLDQFFDRLGTVFVPATVKMQIANGLDAYLPTVPAALPGKPDSVPDETAVLFWDSQQTYTDGFKTLAGRTYTLTHGAVYRPPSGADFPTLFTGGLASEKPVYLFNKPADWMKGTVRHLIGARPATAKPADFLSAVGQALGAIQKVGQSQGAIACAGDDYLVYWTLGVAQAGDLDALTKLLAWSKLVTCAPTMIEAGLWNDWPGMSIKSGDSYNMQFQRRWET